MAEQKSVVDDIKFEDGQSNLTEAQMQAIANEAIAEVKGEGKQKEDEWHNPGDDQSQETKDDADAKAKADADAKAADDAEKKAKEEADAKSKADADEKAKLEAEKNKGESDEQKAVRLKAEKEAAEKKDEFKIPDDQRSKLIEELALKESLTLKEAEEQLKKDEAIVNKYKKDPVEMAKALRHTQREMDRAKAELEATRKAATNPPAPVLRNVREYVESQVEPIKDKLVVLYRKENPELTDDLSDEKVYGLIKRDAIERTTKILEENESKIVSSAKEKKAELIMGLADVDKAFIPDIKAALDRTNARQLLSKDFHFEELVYWAKGRQMDRLIKEAEERGFKRGSEKSTIIGEKTPGAGNKQAGGQGAKKSAESRLNDTQKERARNMFDGAPGMSEEDMFSAYIETYPEEFKK